MKKRLPSEIVNFCYNYAIKNWMYYKDSPDNPRTEGQKKADVFRGLMGEFACKYDLNEAGIWVSEVYTGPKYDDGRDLKTKKETINVKTVKGLNYDSGLDRKLLKNPNGWDKGTIYVMYAIYPTFEYKFVGFIDSESAKKADIILLEKIYHNFNDLVSKLR